MLPKLRATFFCTASGREPVREWLLALTPDERRQIGTDIAYVQFKWPIGKPRIDHLRGSIWEVRTRLADRIARVLFAVVAEEMILLHGFMKSTRRTPHRDINWRKGALGSGGMARANEHRGSSFDDFLREQGLFADVQAAAVKRALAEAVEEAMLGAKLSKVEVARRMGTSRSQLDRVLDPDYTAVQLDTLIKAAGAVGRDLRISLTTRRRPRRAA